MLFAGGILPQFSAKSYGNIIGANDNLKISMMGVNGRGTALAKNFAQQHNSEVIHVCDVDSRAISKCLNAIETRQKGKAKGY